MTAGGDLGLDKISELPQQLMCSIISKLPFNEAVATSILSRQWKDLWKWVSRVEFDPNRIKPWKGDTLKPSSGVGLVRLDPKRILKESTMAKIDKTMESYLLNLNITVCDIVHFPENNGILKFIAKQNNLEELTLACKYISKNIELMEIPQGMFQGNKLLVLKLAHYKMKDAVTLKNCANLKTLTFTRVSFVDDDVTLNEILNCCPNLENLALDLCYSGDLDVNAFKFKSSLTLKECQNLKTLSLTRVVFVEDDVTLNNILNCCPNLENLALDSCNSDDLGGNGFKFLALKGCQNLKTLSLTRIVLVDEDVTLNDTWNNHCPNLENLVLDSCSRTITSRNVFVVRSLKLKSLNLQHMDEKGCIKYKLECPGLKKLNVNYREHKHMRRILERNNGMLKDIKDTKQIQDLRVLCTTLDLNNNRDIIVLAQCLGDWNGLQQIEITNKIFDDKIRGEFPYDEADFWGRRVYPGTMSTKLNVVKIIGFSGRDQEIRFASMLIREAMGLKQLVIECDDTCSKNGAKETLELISAKQQRASNDVSIVLKPGKKYMTKVGDNFEEWMSTLA